MSVADYKFPDTQAQSGTGTNWTNLSGVESLGGTAAQDGGDDSKWLLLTGFGFTDSDIPSGATITGIEAEITRRRAGSLTTAKLHIRAIKGGTLGGSDAFVDDIVAVPTFAAKTIGGDGELWGETWADTDIKSSDFGIAIASEIAPGEGGAALVDFVQVRIYYTEGGDATLTGEAGSFSLTGQTAALKAARKLSASAGSFALTGQDAALTGPGAKTLTAEVGSFTLTGQNVNFEVAVEAGIASYTLTGQAAGLKATRKLTAGAGSYALTGQAASLRRGLSMSAAAGAFTLTGNAADLEWSGRPIWTPVPAATGTWIAVN